MGEGMNEYPWYYALKINPFVTKDDIKEIRELNEWDLLIVFKNGKQFIYDTNWNYYRSIFYKNINEVTMEQEARELAHKIRSIMDRKRITQEVMAELLGISQPAISNYMTGKRIPNALMLKNMAKILGCSTDDFFYDNYNMR